MGMVMGSREASASLLENWGGVTSAWGQRAAAAVSAPEDLSDHLGFFSTPCRGCVCNANCRPALNSLLCNSSQFIAMKRCTATLRTTRSWQARRWASHDKATLTPEALRRKVEAGLGHDAHGNPLRVDTESGTVSTAAGDLPISPVFDPTWIKSRRRQRKDEPSTPTGRFRRKLTLNPYGTTILVALEVALNTDRGAARALATPIRDCGFTGTAIPRYFLQDVELVSHPTTGKPWFAPGPLAFDRIQPIYRPTEPLVESSDGISSNETSGGVEMKESGQKTEKGYREELELGNRRPRRAPLTFYMLNRKEMLDPLGPQPKLLGKLTGPRQGTAWAHEFRGAVWRSDMAEFILNMMRRTIVDTLITRANREHGPEDKFIEPVPSWDAVRDVKRRQSVLWLPRETESGPGNSPAYSQYATLDVDGVQYYRKMAVHNLPWMLGSEEVARLRQSAPAMFEQHEMLVLKYWGSQSMVNLHLLLWRLHGYLARTMVLPGGSEPAPDAGKKKSPKEQPDNRR